MAHVVTAAGLVAKMQNDTGEGYLYRGDIVPGAVPKLEVERLVELGLVKEVEVVVVQVVEEVATVVDENAQTTGSDSLGGPLVAGVPAHLVGMTVADLQAYAGTNEIDVEGATKKDALIAAIAKAEAA